jgi:uncharacterized protein
VTHAPARTCLGCRKARPKRELVRLVRRADGRVAVDARGPGRGAYVCGNPDCVERGVKAGRLSHAFRAACRIDEGLGPSVLAAGEMLTEDRAGHREAPAVTAGRGPES